MCVGSIETVWSGRVTPPHRRNIAPQLHRPTAEISLARGAEAGRFNFGSTVILLLPAGAVRWYAGCGPETVVRMGEALADLNLPES
jgi:phosphatidylserine decarboxylase